MSSTSSIRHCCVFLLLSLATRTISKDNGMQIKWHSGFSKLADCLVNTIENLKSTVLKMSIFGATDSMLLTNILKVVSVPVLINCEEDPKTEGLETRVRNDLVIILNASIDISDLLSRLLWYEGTRFFLLSEMEVDKEIFQRFWEKKVINAFVLLEDKEDVLLYSFLPYGPNDCNSVRPTLLDTWSNGRFLGDGMSKIRESVRITNLNRCPVNVTIVNVKPQVFFQDDCFCNGSHSISGIEGNIMTEIARKFNMEVMYVIALDGIGWGWIKPQPHGVVGEVYTGRSDFGLGLLAPTIERYENLDISVPYDGSECITYGLHKGAGEKQPTWIMILIFEYQGLMWMLIGLVFVILMFHFWLINKTLKISLFPQKFDIFMYLLGSCLGNPIRIRVSFTFRIAVISWIIFTFIITVAYKSSMGSKLTVPTPDPDINTFKELLRSSLKLTGYNNMLRLMQYNDSDADIKLMAERFVVTNFDIDEAVDAIASHQRIAHVRHRSTFLYYSLSNAEAKGHIHLLTDCIYSYYPMFVMRKYSPFQKRTNQIIRRLKESGIISYWTSKYIYQLPKKPNTFEKLSLSHTFGMFFIIFLGYCVATALFVGECLHWGLADTKENIRKTECEKINDAAFYRSRLKGKNLIF